MENAQVARAFLGPGEAYRPYRDNLPFGVVLLRRNDQVRNQALCSSFVNNLPTPEDVLEADPNANVIATYWMLGSHLSGDQLLDCDTLLRHYDYARAAQIRNRYGKANAQGPIFLALQLNDDLDERPYAALLDLSQQTPTQVAQTTADWFSIVVRPAEDLAASEQPQPEAQRERRRGRGLFKRIARFVGSAACSVLGGNSSGQGMTTSVEAFDPVLNRAIGTVRTIVQGTMILSLAANVVEDLVC